MHIYKRNHGLGDCVDVGTRLEESFETEGEIYVIMPMYSGGKLELFLCPFRLQAVGWGSCRWWGGSKCAAFIVPSMYWSTGELVEGIKEGEWSERHVWQVVKDVATALSYVHGQDYAHLDLKPQVIRVVIYYCTLLAEHLAEERFHFVHFIFCLLSKILHSPSYLPSHAPRTEPDEGNGRRGGQNHVD